ncbi:MAG TPA: YhjD/YihY/BrkB family envelope integrity protein, partial [Gemmatimonadales bacterium]|nr:YhjD/YihY/BrkB family envelope integrity protein [Gemmatimonadales bacterium]
MTLRDLGWLFKRALAGWWNDNVPRLGASLAYYTLFALAPILIVAITVAGLVFGADVVQLQVTTEISGLVGKEGGNAVRSMLEGASQRGGNGIATAIGLVTFFLGSTGAFLELQTALNAIWRVKPKPDAGIKDMLLQRLLSFGLVVGVGFVLLVSLLVSTALSALNSYIGQLVPQIAEIWQGVNTLVSLGVVTLLFAM